MSTTEKNRSRRDRRRKRNRLTNSSARKRGATPSEPEEYAQIVRGNRVTHVLVPIKEYEELVKESMALEVMVEGERTGVDPFDDPDVEWVDAEQFALQLAADQIARARKAKGMTQKQLAEKLGMPQSQVSRIERNPDHTTVRTLKKIAKALDVDVSALI